jgi:hypothetical protein
MPFKFGTARNPDDEPFPAERLVEAQQRLSVFDLARAGAFRENAQVTLAGGPGSYRLEVRGGRIYFDDGSEIATTVAPLGWREFVCPSPSCARQVRHVYRLDGEWRCRRCHRLDWSCRHQRRTVGKGKLNRCRSLRRRAGLSLSLFSKIPPRRGRRYLRLVREIREIEAALCEYTANVVDALEQQR